MAQYNTIAESNNFIVLDDYEKYSVLNEPSVVYQTEASLEYEFIQDLRNQGYEYLPDLNTPEALLANVRTQLQALNDVVFTDSEWTRYVEEYLDKPSDSLVEKTRKIQDDYIYDFDRKYDKDYIGIQTIPDKHDAVGWCDPLVYRAGVCYSCRNAGARSVGYCLGNVGRNDCGVERGVA